LWNKWEKYLEGRCSEGKVVFPVQAVKARVNGGLGLLLLNLGTGWGVWAALGFGHFTPGDGDVAPMD